MDPPAKPEFQLDALKHVDPLPGPIWSDRFFFPFFGDSHAESTELLGHDQKKGGDLAALLAVLTHTAERTRDERREELAAQGITEALMVGLEKAIGCVKASVDLARALAAINTPDQFATFLFQFKAAVRNMAPSEKLLLPGGFRNMEGGHVIMHVLERHSATEYSFTVHNAGNGSEYHPTTVTSHPKTKVMTTLKFTKLGTEALLDDAFWYMHWKMLVSTSDDHRCEVLYDVLLPHLLGSSVGVAIAKHHAADPHAASLCEYRTAQRAEVNYLRSMKEAFRYLLRNEGWTPAQTKHFSFLMRRQVLDMAALDLNQLEVISEADAKLLRMACQKLARSATKESETTNPKRLEAHGLEEVYAQLQWVESQVTSKLVEHSPMPQLEMTMKATWEPYPNFALFRRTAPVEQFAGWKKDRAGNDLIDFLSLPARASDLKHFGDVLSSLISCHSLCERLSAKSTSASYFHRLALIQDFFTQILPRPLPPFRSRKPTVDAEGREVPARECLYSSAIIDRATQLQALNLLLELAKHYLSSSKSVSSNRAFEGSHAIVMAAILAVADAVIRIPACDETSIVTMVLNGTEAKYKAKTKAFASPYESMHRGHRGMQSAIAGFQAQLGAFGAGLPPAPKPAVSRSNLPTIEVIVPSPSPPTAATASAEPAAPVAATDSSAAPMDTTAPAPAASPVAMDAETAAQVAQAQKLLTDALASFAKSKALQAEQFAAAAQNTVTPLFYCSLQNGRGMELRELSEKLLLTQPSLAVARGEVLEYFTSQAEVATKAVFNLPTRMNCSTYLGSSGPMLEFVRTLCHLLGYDLNPDAEDEKGGMDDQVSFLEAATWYLTNPKSPFAEHQPELFLYRDIAAMYHIAVSQTDHRRSIKVHRWSPQDATIKWRIKEVNRAKTMIDLNLEIMGEEAVCLDSLPIFSAADASSYITDVHLPSEDDVLHSLNLPSFGEILSSEDSELLLTYLTAPYLRIPLVISFFSTKDRVAVLLNRDVQSMVESVLFEPRAWVTEYDAPLIQQVPAATRAHIGASRGMLLNEIIHEPAVLLESLVTMARLVLELNTGDYTSSSREIILYVVRLMVRVEAHLVFALDNPDEVFRHHRAPTADIITRLETSRAKLRTYFVGPIRSALLEWEAAASEDNDLTSCCVIHAHLALLYRGVRAHEWTADSVAQVLQHSAFLRTWYSAGLTADAAEEAAGQVGDSFFNSNALGMATRFGMSHMGRGGGMLGGRGGGMAGMMSRRFGPRGGRGLGDDADDDDGGEASSASARRRRKGRKSIKGGDESKEEEKKDSKDAKKKGTESEEDGEDDVHLPGLDEEASVEQVREKNPGEGKASATGPLLEVPDQELFEALQYIRRGYVTWLSTAASSDVDDVLQGCLGASTRTAGVVSRGWTLISATAGLWRSQNSDLEVNAQTAELFFKHSTIEPIPNFIAQTADYTQLFGLQPLHCALVAMHDHRYWCRMVGSAFSIKRWDRVEPELVVVNQPMPLPQPNLPGVTWICYNDGDANPISAEACSKCNKRERPKFGPHGFRFEDETYGRMYVPTQMQQHEKWIFDAVEPVINALFGGRAKQAWELYLPTAVLDPEAQTVHMLGRDEMRTWREVIVTRPRGVAQIFSLLEHGRRIFRSLDYASDSRFALRYIEPIVKDKAFPWAPPVRHAAGRLLPAFWDASLVITRDRTDEFGNTGEETFVPSRFLYGLLPSALLDHFFFWHRNDDSLVGFPRDRTQPTWFYRISVRLIQLPAVGGRVQYSAIVTRHKLDPATLDQDDPRASGQDGASSFEMKKQLDASDPLLVAINASKVATLKEMGYTEALSTTILQRFDYDLAIAQSWLADPTNAAELEALKSADPATAAAINNAQSAPSFGIADGPSSKHQLLLLNLKDALPGSMLYRASTVLSRIEDLSYVLCWSTTSVSAVGDEVAISLIELPRLKLRLQPRIHVDEKGAESVRLYSLDHANMFVSDYRDDLLNQLVDGLANSILLENSERELFVLIPNCIVHRPNITAEPFSTEIVPERGASSWMGVMESRFFLYNVHTSHTFLLTQTQSSAVYLILLRLLARQYTEAFNVVQSCEADRKLSDSEEWVLQQLAQAATDFHPNAAAIRLKISLVIMHSQSSYPWRVQDEYKLYLEKLNSVSAVCRLTIEEELYLLKHLRSGGGEDAADEAEVEDSSELDNKPHHLDTPLANRLSFLQAMIEDEEEYAQESTGLKYQSQSLEAVPILTRTRSGRKCCYLSKPVQRGCKNLWAEVESAVDRYYSDFSFNSRTWDAQIEYSRPDQAATLLGPAIKTLNGVWKDTITGLGRKLGFFFLSDLLTRQVDICLTDPGVSSSASLGKLFGRLLFLKSTVWGVRFDLAVHRSYRERSFVPFVALALLERLPISVAKAAPKLPWAMNRADFINGCSVSNKGQDGPEMSAGGRYLESLLQFTQQFVRMPERLNDTSLRIHVAESSETIVVASLHSLVSAPQPTDFACNQRRIEPFEHEEVVLTETDCRCFSDQLLACIDLPKYVRLCASEETVASTVAFDVSKHTDAQTHVAKALLKRMDDDVRVYAKQINEGQVPKIACLLDDTLAKFTQLHLAPAADQAYVHDAALSAGIAESISVLNALVVDLEAVAARDYAQIPLSVAAMLDLANQVSFDDEESADDDAVMQDASTDTHLHRMQFLVGRYSEVRPSVTLDYLCGCLLSTHLADDLRAVNPFLPAGSLQTITAIVQAFLLRVSRLGHIYRCTAMVVELIALLRGVAHLTKKGKEGAAERSVYYKALTFKASALATALVTKRFCFGPEAFIAPTASTAVTTAPDAMSFEPRYLLFEYLFSITLRKQQVALLHTFLSSDSSVQQMIMGAGKTTIIGPLLGLILGDGARLVMQVVPSALLEFSRATMRSRFTRVISKKIATFTFDRSVKTIRHVTALFDKLNAARKTRGIVLTSPESIKALMLKHVELLHQLESAPSQLTPAAQLRLSLRSEMADQLSHILALWRNGALILDEVDLLLHPLRSELNFPILEKFALDLSPDRWELPIHLLDSVFFAMYRTMSVPFGQSDHATQVLEDIRRAIEAGVTRHAIQASPHLVLLDADFYHARLKEPLARWLLCWLKAKQHLHVKLSDEAAIEYVTAGPLGASAETCALVRSTHSAMQRKVLHLSHDWLSSFLPHVFSKINRVSFGLLTKEDMQLVDQNMPDSRKLCAVPFVGKDVPSHASEFAHPDILCGLTILAYRYEGMRRSDVRRVVASLQRQMRNQIGPFSMRPAAVTFDQWCDRGKQFAQRRHDKEVEDEEKELKHAAAAAAAEAASNQDESKMSDGPSAASSSSAAAAVKSRRKLKLTPIVPLAIFQMSDRQQMRALFTRVRHLPDLVHHYLERLVFPAVLQHQTTKLSASGQELGGSLLFGRRVGFSGTPSDLLPLELGACGFEQGSEGNIVTTLTNPTIVRAECKTEWSVRQLLSEVANSDAHALIDTGALITGFTNLEVARYLLDHGLPGLDGVVFLDRLDRQMILLRASFTVVPLAQCGIDPSKRFTFYDQIHSTGIDIKQSLNAIAICTLGKDMTFRDYAQGAFRMRGIGKGQTISLYVIPEVLKLISAEVKPAATQPLIVSVAAWLTVNSMRSERLQFMQLCSQNMRNVWRKRAYEMMLMETTPVMGAPVDPRRYWRFQEVHTPELLHVRRCINTFREPIEFTIEADITEARTFAKLLKEELDQNRDLIVNDPTALDEIRRVEELAAGAVGNSTELQARSLNQEMVNEQEQEQEQKKTVEQEEQSQVRFSREDEHERSWKVYELARFLQQADTPSLSRSTSTACASGLASLGLGPAAGSSASASGTVHQLHPFYGFNQFSVRGVAERDIDMPSHVLLSSNYYRTEWAAMGQRRLKNVQIVLDWIVPNKRSPAAESSSASASASAMTDVPSPASAASSSFSASSILSSAQETSLRTAFAMFSDASTGGRLISVAQVVRMMREVGEDLSSDDLAALAAGRNDQQLGYEEFRQFIVTRSVNRTDMQGRRFFVCVSLKEAETLRRLIHTQHPLFAAGASQSVSIGLRLLNGALLDASPGFIPAGAGQQDLALQSLRFIDCQMFYNDLQLSLLLKSLQHNKPVRRQAFFENLLRCRRRDRRRFHDTPLNSIFLLDDEHSLLSYRAKVARVRFELRSLSLSLQDAFSKFDAQGDTYLNTTELAFALIEYLKLPLTMADVAQIMKFANASGSGLLDFKEFADLLREPEIVSQTTQDTEGMDDSVRERAAAATAAAMRMEIDDESPSPSPDDDGPAPSSLPLVRNVSTTRLTLSPEYERLYAEEESLRAAKQAEVEQEAQMAAAEKLAREIERKELEESQARDWQQIQELRKLSAMDELWTCAACTFKNEPTTHYCTCCETKRPAEAVQQSHKPDLHSMEDVGEGHDGPAFWVCAACSYNNDHGNTACEICNAQKPKITRGQKKVVSLWACPVCTRLVTSDKQSCDVCVADRDAIRSTAPATQKAGSDFSALFGSSLLAQGGVPAHVSDLTGKVVAVYFSASWCAPCRSFTPQLASIYSGAIAAGLPFEVVFVSADNDVESFNAYFGSMPWRAVKYSDADLRKQLNTTFEVQGIPTLVVLDSTGAVLTTNGRSDIAQAGDAAVAEWCRRGASKGKDDTNASK